MVPIIHQWCPIDKYSVKCPYQRTPWFFVVHNSGNDAPAVNEITYMIRRPESVSFHYAIDDIEIRQALPLDRNAWASGDGNGPGNMNGIHIEICYSLSGGPKFAKAEENTAEFIAAGLKEYGWGLDKVKKHWDFDPEKRCPHRTLDLGWDRFLKMIEKYMKDDKEEEIVTYEQFVEYMKRYETERSKKDAAKWASDAWKKATDTKFMDGTRPLDPLTRQEYAVIANSRGLLDN